MLPLPLSGFGSIPNLAVPGPWPMLAVGLALLAFLAASAAVLAGLRRHQADRPAGGRAAGGPGAVADVRRPTFP